MTLKKVLLIIVTLLLTIPLHANNRQARRLERNFQKQKYEKCLKKTTRYLKRKKITAVPYYYRSFVYFGYYKDNIRTNDNEKYLRSSTANLQAALSKDRTHYYKENYTLRINEIHDSLFAFVEKQQKLPSPSKSTPFLNNKLIVLFSDSTFFIAPAPKAPITQLKPSQSTDSIAEYRKYLIARADSLIGVNYKYGGLSPDTGFDCSGFVKYVYMGIEYELPHKAKMLGTMGHEQQVEEAQPGDLVLFGRIDKNGKPHIYHAGMIHAIEDDISEIIHCVSGGVHIAKKGTPNFDYWIKNLISIKNILVDK